LPPVEETALIPRGASVDDQWAGDPTLHQRELDELIRAACEAQTAHDNPVGAGVATATDPGSTPHPTLRRGMRLEGGQLCILEALDGGGMGEVYLAWHEILNDEVVVKVSQAPAMEARFRHEIELQNWLGAHPQIVGVKTAGQFEGRYYLMMDYIPGADLGRYVAAHGSLPWREACAYIHQASVGFAHAHDRGVVHRDVKSTNLIRTEVDGSINILILDWGLALRLYQASADEDARLTQPGSILGTPDYIAPEQISNPASVGPASDLYSLGCTLYELLSGHPPFHDHSNKLIAHLESPIPALPPELGVPGSVERVLRRLLAKRAQDRYSSAREFEEALGEAVRRAEEPDHPRPWVLRHAGLAAGLIGAVATVVAIAVYPAPWWGPGLQARIAQPDRNRPNQPRSVTAAALLPLTGELTARVWTPGGEGKRGWKIGLETPQSLPVRNGELIHIEATLNQPAYVYLLWLDGQGKITPLYPWIDQDFSKLPAEASMASELHDPPQRDKGWPVEGPSGLETILMLARLMPLPPGTDLTAVIGTLPPAPLRDPFEVAVRGFDVGQAVDTIDLGSHRGPAKAARQIDEPLLQLLERLRPHFEVIRAVRFAYSGN
jgi:hypothetical protein